MSTPRVIPRCTECAAKLVDAKGKPKPAGTKTCSQGCRTKRSRRMKREQAEATARAKSLPPHMKDVSEVVTGGARDAAHEVMKEELRPIVREAMTENVLAGIGTLVNLTPRAIDCLEADLSNPDDTIRQRAYTLLLKYTMGNPSVAPPSQQQQPGGMNVVFNLPRPGDAATPQPTIEATATEETRPCEDCGLEQPESAFVSGGPRCTTCHDKMHDLLVERFGDAYKQ